MSPSADTRFKRNDGTTGIVGLPAADRPRCVWCGRPFKAIVHLGIFKGWDQYDGLFDRLLCARHFAGAAHRAGYVRPDWKPTTRA